MLNNNYLYSCLWSEDVFIEFEVSHVAVVDVVQDKVGLLRAEEVDTKGGSLEVCRDRDVTMESSNFTIGEICGCSNEWKWSRFVIYSP